MSFSEVMAAAKARLTPPCLWPAPFDVDTPEAGYLFVRECRSYLETEGEAWHIPDWPSIEAYCDLWHECKASGRMLVTQKCRRMVISWTARALELHQMGLGRCDLLLVGEDLQAAARHVWRLKFIYDDLRARHPEWKLPEATSHQYNGERELKRFALPNGSVCNYGNGEAGSFQGEGYKIVTLEEPALYRFLSAMVAQARITTLGPGGKREGTLVNMISNTPKQDALAAFAFGEIKKDYELYARAA